MFVFFSEFTKPGLFQARIFPQLGCALGVLTFFCSGADCVRRPSRVPRIIFCINLVADRVPGKFFAKRVSGFMLDKFFAKRVSGIYVGCLR